MIKDEYFDEQGELTDAFLRGTGLTRLIGWTIFSPALFYSFHLAHAYSYWFIIGALFCYINPLVMIPLCKRSSQPLNLIFGNLVFESIMLMCFTEVVGMDPVFLMICLTVMIFNAGSLKGVKGSSLVFAVMMVTLFLIKGRFRALPHVALLDEIHLFMVILLGICITLLTHQVFLLLRHQVHLKQQFSEQNRRLETLHAHLLETITHPFLSDEEILEHIGAELSSQQVEQYKKRIRSRQSFESLGRRLPYIVHDAKNLLHPMFVLSDLLKESVDQNPEALELLDDVDSVAHRLSDLLNVVDTPHQETAPSHVSSQLKTVANEVYSLLKSSSPEHIQVQFENRLEDESVRLPLDEISLHRVISNLCLNGIHAMKEKGTLLLRMRELNSEERKRVSAEKDHITFSVSDTGIGMDHKVKQKLFEPYFTTRKDEGGTGLGLANTQAILSEIGGVILVESELGKGTEFRLLLPIV